jgi:hypothetical protein
MMLIQNEILEERDDYASKWQKLKSKKKINLQQVSVSGFEADYSPSFSAKANKPGNVLTKTTIMSVRETTVAVEKSY